MSNEIPRIIGARLYLSSPYYASLNFRGIPRGDYQRNVAIEQTKYYFFPVVARTQYLKALTAQRIPNRFAPDVENTIRLYMPRHKKGKRKRTKPIFRRKRRN